jgi:ABC-2 type transport system ATP-binding protein
MADSPIVVDGLEKRYDDQVAVGDLSLTVHDGEIYGLLGRNGAGKSTVIDVLVGATPATAGDVSVFGSGPRTDVVETHARLGVLPDRFGVYESMSGLEHVRYALDARKAGGDPREPLVRVGLGDVTDQPAGTYSKGMQQRLGIAIAIAGSPDLLLLDEPFSALDPNGVQLVMDALHHCRRNGATILVSSHDMARVERLCDRVGILSDGNLLVEGPVGDLVDESPLTGALELTFERSPEDDYLQAIDDHESVISLVGSDRRYLVKLTGSIEPSILNGTVEPLTATVKDVVEREPTLEDAFLYYTAMAEN